MTNQRGTLFVPVEKVGNDYWGGSNHGNNLYSDSSSPRRHDRQMKWFRQLVHHDIWDYDLAAAPILIDVRRDGRTIPAVAQQTKMALLFIFNRETGEPIFGIEERKVPQTSAPGEWTIPTQPFPVKPPPLARNSLKRSELSKVTPEHKEFCQGLWDKYKLADAVPYDPWHVGQDILVFPGAQGGGNWHGATFNKPLGLIITNVMTAGQWGHLQAGGRRGGGGSEGAAGGRGAGRGPRQQPQCAAAHGQGHARRRTVLGSGEALELLGTAVGRARRGQRQHRRHRLARAARRLRRAGRERHSHRHARLGRRHHHRRQPRLHRRDDRRLLPRVRRAQRKDALVRQAAGARRTAPSTYMGRDGKQYVVVGANGGGFFGSPTSDEVIAYRLKQ